MRGSWPNSPSDSSVPKAQKPTGESSPHHRRRAMLSQARLDLVEVDPQAEHLRDALGAPDEEEEPLVVKEADVAGPEDPAEDVPSGRDRRAWRRTPSSRWAPRRRPRRSAPRASGTSVLDPKVSSGDPGIPAEPSFSGRRSGGTMRCAPSPRFGRT